MLTSLPVSIRNVTGRLEGTDWILRVGDPNALTQVIGWLKFRTKGEKVLYRGQTERYKDMMASGLRGAALKGRQGLSRELQNYIDGLMGKPCSCKDGPFDFGQRHRCTEQMGRKGRSSAIAAGTYRAAMEPLLQHYGIRTRWIDLVDNIWIALWFACYKQVSKGEFAYHQRRSPAQEGPDSVVYIAVMSTGDLKNTDVPGYQVSSSTRVVDLRYAVPSTYLRPHAQHGFLMAPANLPDRKTGSLHSQVLAYLEIPLQDALNWLGDGVMTSSFVLFPPAVADEGYRKLLLHSPKPPDILGSVVIYGGSS